MKINYAIITLILILQVTFLYGQNATKVVRETTLAAPTEMKGNTKSGTLQDTAPKIVSNGYYSWEATGDPQKDADNIQIASDKFKKEHPDIYRKIVNDTTKVKILIDDFNKLSKKQQSEILSNSNIYRIVKSPEKK